MMNVRKTLQLLNAAVIATALSACAHGAKKSDAANGKSAGDEVARLETDVNQGYNEQYDVLAAKEFAKSRDWLKEAKSDLESGESSDEVMNDVAQGRKFLDKTKDYASERAPRLQGVLDARQAAIDAGAKNVIKQQPKIKEVDDMVRDVATDRTISTSTFNKLQKDYLDLELSTIQSAQLGQIKARLDAANKNSAPKNTPNTYKVAQMDYANAMNVIAANRHNPEGYHDAVVKSEKSTQLLEEVLAQTKRGNEVVSESVAMDLVRANRKMSNMQSELTDSEREQQMLLQQQQQMNSKNDKLQSKAAREAAQAAALANLDQVFKNARKEFSKDEAEVYREGDKLLIRLKAIKFPVGKADVPPASLALLARVKGVASDLNPQQVVVEGHTDSTGNAALNMQLSQNRAEAVANYFGTNGIETDKIQAVGEGYKKPIATNKTKAGRAKNRRVDVIIVPGAAEQVQQQNMDQNTDQQ